MIQIITNTNHIVKTQTKNHMFSVFGKLVFFIFAVHVFLNDLSFGGLNLLNLKKNWFVSIFWSWPLSSFFYILALFPSQKRKLFNFCFCLIFIFNKKKLQSCQFFTSRWKALMNLWRHKQAFLFFNINIQ